MRRTVLVVEDEPEHRAVARITLRLAGYDVREASSGEGAMVMLGDFRPDAVVLDIRLPGIDGLAVLTHLRSSDALRSVPVVLCSAHTAATPVDVANADRLTTFVAKPFHPERLVAAVSQVLAAPDQDDAFVTHVTQPAAATEPTRVLIVEDHSILTQSLKLTLRLEGMDAYVADQLDEPAVLATARRVRPHLVLLDLHLGDGCHAVPMIRPLVGIGTRVLVLTGSTDHGLHGAALDAGAVSILHKGESLEQLCQDIRDVVDGRSVMRPSRRDELLTHGRHHIALESKLRSLSTREGEVLTALADGKSAEAIASEQFVSIGTVRSHIRSILRKLDVGSQLAAVAAARRGGWASGLPASDREYPIL